MQFARTEGIGLAHEPTHALAASVREVLDCRESGEEKVLLTAMCGHGHLDMTAYDRFFSGDMIDFDYPEEKVTDALTRLPVVG